MMRFLTNYPAMVIDDYLVISDLHLGITRGLYEKGISMPSQVKSMLERIHELKKLSKAKGLVILGDLKHRIPGTSWQEQMEIPNFLSRLKFEKIIIIKGNHDGDIEKLIPSKKISVKKSLIIGKYYLTHGHRKLGKMKSEIVVIGHSQPHVRFQDTMKARYSEPVWVRGTLKNGKRLVIVPAFNELCGATTVNKDKLLGPIAKNLNYKKSHVYLLDGIDLGRLSDLRSF
jgi:hypothetical protein